MSGVSPSLPNEEHDGATPGDPQRPETLPLRHLRLFHQVPVSPHLSQAYSHRWVLAQRYLGFGKTWVSFFTMFQPHLISHVFVWKFLCSLYTFVCIQHTVSLIETPRSFIWIFVSYLLKTLMRKAMIAANLSVV